VTPNGAAWRTMDAHEANQALYASGAVPGVEWSCARMGIGGFNQLWGTMPDGTRFATSTHERFTPDQVKREALQLADAWALGELR
jgi:hypothetical protein